MRELGAWLGGWVEGESVCISGKGRGASMLRVCL